MKPAIYIVGHDLHFPRYSKPTFNVMLAMIAALKPQGFIFGGDQLDNAEISHHNSNKPLYKPAGSYKRNTEQFDSLILKPLEELLKKREKVWLTGNHDDWERQYIEEHPEFQGYIERPEALQLAKRGWEVVELGHSKRIGKLNVIHGEILTGIGNQAGLYPSRKAVELYGDNVLAGHTHAMQSYTKISPVNEKKKYMGWIAGILGDCNPDYLRNRPTAWLNGFTIVEVHDDGNFNLYPIVVTRGRCSYGGVLYE